MSIARESMQSSRYLWLEMHRRASRQQSSSLPKFWKWNGDGALFVLLYGSKSEALYTQMPPSQRQESLCSDFVTNHSIEQVAQPLSSSESPTKWAAPSFAVFGGREPRRLQQKVSIFKRLACGRVRGSHPCKGRKDGARSSVLVRRKQKMGHAASGFCFLWL